MNSNGACIWEQKRSRSAMEASARRVELHHQTSRHSLTLERNPATWFTQVSTCGCHTRSPKDDFCYNPPPALRGRHRVHRLAGHTLGTPGVTGTLRVRAAREIGCIDLAGMDRGDGVSVNLPLHEAERRCVTEGERHRRGTILLPRDQCAALD